MNNVKIKHLKTSIEEDVKNEQAVADVEILKAKLDYLAMMLGYTEDMEEENNEQRHD